MRRPLFVLVGFILCSGQMCGSSPVPAASPGDSAASILQNGIPAGLYAGQVVNVHTVYSVANFYQPSETRSTSTYSAAFGATGAPLGKDGTPIVEGYTSGTTADAVGVTYTISDLYLLGASGVIPRTVTLFSDVVMRLGDVSLTGYQREDFVLQPSGSVLYHSEMQLTGETGLYSWISDGTLNPL